MHNWYIQDSDGKLGHPAQGLVTIKNVFGKDIMTHIPTVQASRGFVQLFPIFSCIVTL